MKRILLFPRLKKITYFFIFGFVLFGCTNQTAKEIDMSGVWNFKADATDVGIAEKWYEGSFPDTIKLPGSIALRGKGNPVGYDTQFIGHTWIKYADGKQWFENKNYKPYLSKDEFLYPFWLIADKYYLGAAWYQKEINIPADWSGKTIELFLERCHWETQVWLDDNYLGKQNSLGTAHRYRLPASLVAGSHKLTVCVDNRIKDIDVGADAHSVSDNTQSSWNGIVGQMKLIQKEPVHISRVSIYPDVENKLLNVEVEIENLSGEDQQIILSLEAKSTDGKSVVQAKKQEVALLANDKNLKVKQQYLMGEDVKLWDEFQPNLYDLTVELKSGKLLDSVTETFGMRSFKAVGTTFQVNGRPIFLRGTLECCIFPKTGFPPTDIESWEQIIKVCRAHGLNHIRFHSWCPPKAAFDVADKLGFYYQVECSAWATVGDGKPIDQWLYDESERMVAAYGNHPSFCMMPYGNEPSGKNHKEYLTEFVKYWKNKKDDRRVYTTGAGWPLIPESDYYNTSSNVRIQGWGQELNSIINGQPPRTDYDWSGGIKGMDKPMVSHEIGQWCVYPNLKEAKKYTGVLKATNFEIFKRSLEAHQMLQLADSFLLASGKLQALCYKADIEAALRTPGFGGFQLLDLHDFPGQGTALVGVVDPFWEEKGYISPEEFSRFCNQTVPLARFKKLIFTSDEKVEAEIEIANFGPKEIPSVVPVWRILDTNKKIIKQGELKATKLSWGNGIKLGSISESLPVTKAAQFSLEVTVAEFTNNWDFWVYPAKLPEIGNDILIVKSLTKRAQSALENGGKVLLTLEKGSIKEDQGGEVGIGFSSIFWNTAWTNGQKPHTLGILCNPKNPALAQFPTEYHSNYQWRDAMSHSNAISLEGFSSRPNPIVRVIDDWVTNRSLALLFEAKVGNGKLLVSGIDLQSDLDNRPEARQLLYSLKSYMNSEQFAPVTKLTVNEIRDLF